MMALRQAIKRDAEGRFTISPLDFVKILKRYKWDYSLRDANMWIETHTTTFRDISPTDGDERVFQVSTLRRHVMFALVDVNSFYASFETVFRPDLRGKPVIVLSNNDDCVIARSAEAKKLQMPMGAPYFK